jgi:hypothetical protein
MDFLYAITRITGETPPIHTLISMFRVFASAIAISGTYQGITLTGDKTMDLFIRSREIFILLTQYAELAGGNNNNRDGEDNRDDKDSGDGPGFHSLLDLEELSEDQVYNTDSEDIQSIVSNISQGTNSDPDIDMESNRVVGPTPIQATKKKLTKWDRLRRLPNFHVGLYIADNVREYALIINYNILARELAYLK